MEKKRFYENCVLCPRECHVNRWKGQKGICQVTAVPRVARAALHFWEEPCISGKNGSGTVFFGGCSLHCKFCQNEAISHGKRGNDIREGRLPEIFLELQEKGANNINLVTPGQYIPHIVEAVESARNQGLGIPVIYNTGSYEKVESLKQLEGIVDVYLPDFKYMDSALAAKYSNAPDYPKVAKAAIAEMVRQQPQALFYPETGRMTRSGENRGQMAEEGCRKFTDSKKSVSHEAEDGFLIGKGVIVRQLLLPGYLKDAKTILSYLYETYGDQIYLSLMSQYTPMPRMADDPMLNRTVTKKEYEKYVNDAIALGVVHGFIQEGETAKESFIPDFDGEGV